MLERRSFQYCLKRLMICLTWLSSICVFLSITGDKDVLLVFLRDLGIGNYKRWDECMRFSAVRAYDALDVKQYVAAEQLQVSPVMPIQHKEPALFTSALHHVDLQAFYSFVISFLRKTVAIFKGKSYHISCLARRQCPFVYYSGKTGTAR